MKPEREAALRVSRRAWTERKLAAGLCADCGQPRCSSSARYCQHHKDSRLLKHREWRKKDGNRQSAKRRYKEKYPEKHRAHRNLRTNVWRGNVIVPDRCSQCGIECKPEAHHEDYAKPLEVIWACKPCHVKLDKAKKKREEL